jgi:hypothetical protein
VKLLVDAEGWVRVSQPALLAAGLDPAADPRTLQLFAEGAEVPLLLTGVHQGRFGPDATLEFYGSGLDTPWTGTRTYWLTWGRARGQRLAVAPAMGAGGPPAPASFLATVTRADRVLYVATLLNGAASNFFGPVLSSDPVPLSLPVPAPDPGAAESATLTVTLQGLTPEGHHVGVAWNASPVGTLTWSGALPGTLSVPLPPRSLLSGENTLTLTPAGESEEDVSLLDTVTLTYPRRYVAEGERLRATAPGGSALSISGFTDPRLQALDLSDPSAPVLLSGRVAPAGDGTFTLTLHLPGAGERTLVAWSEAAVRAPAALLPYTPVALNAADLVLLAPAAFHQALAPLVALREQQGLSVALLDPQALYDAYSFGAKDPAAIKSFLTAARQASGHPPRYLLLVGVASVDPRDYLGTGRPDLLPTPSGDTALLETAEDSGYADLDGTGRPALAVGRLPVTTEAELSTVVGKLLAYEATPPTAPGARTALFLTDTAADFDYAGATAALAAGLPAPFAAAPLLTDRAGLLSAWGQGAGLLLYLGHGSVSSWSAQGLLGSEDAPTLGTGTPLPVVLAFTCFTGFHHDPYTGSLAAALLTAPGGAIAVWGSSGMTEPTAQLPLAAAALQTLQPTLRLGDWLRGPLGQPGLNPDVRATWTLFGDPAMPLQ